MRDGLPAPQVGIGILIDGMRNEPRSAPPRLGEHSQSLLRELLGYSDAKVRELTENRII